MTEPRSGMTSEDATTLYYLQRTWEGSYRIDCDADGTWHATRITDGASPLSAGSAPQLRELIADDYGSWIREVIRPGQ